MQEIFRGKWGGEKVEKGAGTDKNAVRSQCRSGTHERRQGAKNCVGRASDYSVILRVLVRKGVSPGKDCLLEESHTGQKWLSKYPHHTQSLVGATKRKIAFL